MLSAVRFCAAAAASLVIAFANAGLPASKALAESYPERVVKIVNPFPPGGSVDITARMLAQKLSESGGQFIVETKSGAGGNVGSDFVAKSDPDGYTLLFTAPGPLAVNKTLYRTPLPFDPETDFAPIAIFAKTPIVLMVNPKLPINNVKELLDYARANPGQINFGSAGLGSTPHLSGELMKTIAKVELTHVPYRGTGPAMSDLVAGHIQMMFDLLPASLQQISSGNVRALANAGATRAKALKDLPTVAEQGLPNFVATTWYGILVPAGTPPAIIGTLNSAINAELGTPSVREKIALEGGVAIGGTPEHFADVIKTDAVKWAEVVRASGAKVD